MPQNASGPVKFVRLVRAVIITVRRTEHHCFHCKHTYIQHNNTHAKARPSISTDAQQSALSSTRTSPRDERACTSSRAQPPGLDGNKSCGLCCGVCGAGAARLHGVEGAAGAAGLGELGGGVPSVGVRTPGAESCSSESQTAVLVSAGQSVSAVVERSSAALAGVSRATLSARLVDSVHHTDASGGAMLVSPAPPTYAPARISDPYMSSSAA
jgi:hypothetical protein